MLFFNSDVLIKYPYYEACRSFHVYARYMQPSSVHYVFHLQDWLAKWREMKCERHITLN